MTFLLNVYKVKVIYTVLLKRFKHVVVVFEVSELF